MMIGDRAHSNPTIQILPWDYYHAEDPTAQIHCDKAMAALQRYLPSNRDDGLGEVDDFDFPVDAFSCDDFRMFEFKVRPCAVARSHDWTGCPFAHPGEKARRRDPRRYRYSGDSCPDFRRGDCRKGDACEHAHGVFEAWLHPARYRTQPCKDGIHCRRRVCFFAHTPDQVRVLSRSAGSPDASPPLSPSTSVSWESASQLAESISGLQLSKMKLGGGLSLCGSPPSWVIGSPRSPSVTRPGYMSLPSTPVRAPAKGRPFDAWGGASFEEEPMMERVESGKELRDKIYAKISEENSLEREDRVRPPFNADPDLEWVSELVK